MGHLCFWDNHHTDCDTGLSQANRHSYYQNSVVVLALESYSVATVLFPAAITVACIMLMLLIVYRRRILEVTHDSTFK